MDKKRGKFLTVLVILGVIGLIQIPYYLVNTSTLSMIYGNVPTWYPLFAVFGLVWGAATFVGIWLMKKWAVYMLIFSTILTFLIQLVVLKPIPNPGMVYAMTMISAGIWFWAIYRKWKVFK